MNRKKYRARETRRFLKWISDYRGRWYLICTPGEQMTMSKMYSLIKKLRKEGFYELIFVLLMVHRDAEFMRDIPNHLALDMLTKAWPGRQDDVLERILTYFA